MTGRSSRLALCFFKRSRINIYLPVKRVFLRYRRMKYIFMYILYVDVTVHASPATERVGVRKLAARTGQSPRRRRGTNAKTRPGEGQRKKGKEILLLPSPEGTTIVCFSDQLRSRANEVQISLPTTCMVIGSLSTTLSKPPITLDTLQMYSPW